MNLILISPFNKQIYQETIFFLVHVCWVLCSSTNSLNLFSLFQNFYTVWIFITSLGEIFYSLLIKFCVLCYRRRVTAASTSRSSSKSVSAKTLLEHWDEWYISEGESLLTESQRCRFLSYGIIRHRSSFYSLFPYYISHPAYLSLFDCSNSVSWNVRYFTFFPTTLELSLWI